MICELKEKAPNEHQVQQLYQILKVSQSWHYQRPKAVAHKANLEKLASETCAVLATKAELRVPSGNPFIGAGWSQGRRQCHKI